MNIKHTVIHILYISVKILLNILKWILGVFFIIGFSMIAIEHIIYIKPFSFQLILSSIFLLILAIYSFIVFFFKTSVVVKIIYIILFVIYPYFNNSIPEIVTYQNQDTCIDIGICTEGMTMKNNQGQIVPINKENCISNGYVWYEKDKSCNLRKK